MQFNAELYVDKEIIGELKELLDDDFCDLITTYISDAKNNLDKINKGLEISDFDTLSKVAHTLKGSSANLGVIGMSEICHKLCEMSNDPDRKDELGDLVIKAGELFISVEKELNSYL